MSDDTVQGPMLTMPVFATQSMSKYILDPFTLANLLNSQGNTLLIVAGKGRPPFVLEPPNVGVHPQGAGNLEKLSPTLRIIAICDAYHPPIRAG